MGTALPGSVAAKQGLKIHPLSLAVLRNVDLTQDISAHRAALIKIARATLGDTVSDPDARMNDYRFGGGPPRLPLDGLTDAQLERLIETPRMAEALAKDSITRRRLARDAEAVAISKGIIPLLVSAEGVVATWARMQDKQANPARYTTDAIYANRADRGFGESLGNSLRRLFGQVEAGAGIYSAMGTASTAKLARESESYWDVFTTVAGRRELLGSTGYLPDPLALVTALGEGVGAGMNVALSGGLGEDNAARLEEGARAELELAIEVLNRVDATAPMSPQGAAFMGEIQKLNNTFGDVAAGMFNLIVNDPIGFAMAQTEILVEQLPIMAAAIVASRVAGPRAGMAVSTLGTFGQELLRVNQLEGELNKWLGVEFRTPEGQAALLNNPSAQRRLINAGVNRAAIIAGGQLAVFGYFRGGTFIPYTSRALALPEQMIVSAFLDGASEAAAGFQVTGKIDWRESFTEAVFGVNLAEVSMEFAIAGAGAAQREQARRNNVAFLEGSNKLKGAINGIPVAQLDTAASVLGEKLESEGIETIYIRADKLIALDQDGNFSKTLGLDPEEVSRLAAEGGLVEVSAATYVRHILAADGFDALIEHATDDPLAPTAAERIEYEESGIGDQIDDQLRQRTLARLAPGVDEGSLTKLNTDMTMIQDDVAAQLEATGNYDANKSRLYGLLTAQRYAARAIRIAEETGESVDASALFASDNLQIRGAEGVVTEGAIEQAAAAFDTTPEKMKAELDAVGGDITQTPLFKEWSGSSNQLRDDDGNVLTMYHITAGDFDTFVPGGPELGSFSVQDEQVGPNDSGRAIWLSPDPENMPAAHRVGGFRDAEGTPQFKEGTNVMPLYATVKSPLVLDTAEMFEFARETYGPQFPELLSDEARAMLIADGYDGVFLFRDGKLAEVLVLDPTQIKSATGNRGTFDPASNNILEQAAAAFDTTPEQLKAELDEAGGDIRQTPLFKAWFKKSAVVDENGDPRVVYHGSNADIEAFDPAKLGSKNFFAESAMEGFFFGGSPETADNYTGATQMDVLGLQLRQNPALLAVADEFSGEYGALSAERGAMTEVVREEVMQNPKFQAFQEALGVSLEDPADMMFSVVSRAILGDHMTLIVDQRLEATGWQARLDELTSRASTAAGEVASELLGHQPNITPVYLSLQNPLVVDMSDPEQAGELTPLIKRGKDEGHDGIIFKNLSDGGPVDDIFVAFEPTQIKSSIGNTGAFSPTDPLILNQDSVEKKKQTKQDKRVSSKNAHGLMPYLRDFFSGKPRRSKKDAITQTTNNKNARQNLNRVDEVLALNPDAHTSPEAWLQMLADAYGVRDVPMAPHRFIEEIGGQGVIDNLARLTPGQIEDANHGFENAARFREAYTSGKLGVETTAKLFLWSFLSRGVSPYTQEGLFIDAFPGIDKWIKQAAAGKLDVAAYSKWAKTVAPKGSGLPGASSTHNLNAFGKDFLTKMSQPMEGSNQSKLEYIHDLMSDPKSTGQQIRREFAAIGEGVGIDNKVVSFTLLVAGFDDVMVMDRVQFRQAYNDGRFDGVNIYDGFKKSGKVVTGSGFSKQGDGARGILIYEAMERAISGRVDDIYAELGREGQGSVGRYHWETWVADSQQEASHGSLGAILPSALGDDMAIHKVTAKQGEYGSYAYGARYGVDGAGISFFIYPAPSGSVWAFTVEQFVEFQKEVRKPKNGVVPTKFKVQETGNEPWYAREEVDAEALEQLAERISSGPAGDGAGTLFQDGQDETVSGRPPADGTVDGQDQALLNQDAGLDPAHIERILHSDNVDIGLKVGKKARFWRGVNPNSGAGGETYGTGLYVSGSRKEAADFSRDGGRIVEMGHADLPQNPLRFTTILDYQNWLHRAQKTMGLSVREFNAKHGDMRLFITALDPSIDGIQISTGRDALFVKYDGRFLLEQGAPTGARGSFTPSDVMPDQDGNPINLIQIFEAADPTTFLHESGHFWLEQLKADALAVGGGFQKDFKIVTDWWASRPLELREEAVRRAKKAKDKDSVAALQQMTEAQVSAYARSGELRGAGPSRYLSVAMHEQFARGVENYFAEGRAPSLSLAGVFSAFKVWVGSVYAKIASSKLDVQFSAEVAQVVDRMLASSEEIARIEGQYDLVAMYSTAAQAGMTPKQFSAYQKKVAEGKEDRRARQLAKHIRELKRERTAWWQAEREALRGETSQEIASQPAYRLLYALTNQGLADGSTLPDGEEVSRMDRAILKELVEEAGFSLDDIPKVGSKAIYEPPNEGGLAPGVVAKIFGYDDVDSMILDLVDTPPYAQAVEASIDAKMEEAHGSIASDVESEALASAYSEKTAQVLAAELTALRTTEPAFKQVFVRAYARDRLLALPTAEARPYRFLAAEKRHANMAGDALKRGDRVDAYKHQFQRLVNHYMATEAIKAEKDIEKKTRYLRTFTKAGKKFPAIEAEYVTNILRILATVNFGRGKAGRQNRDSEINALIEFINESAKRDGSILDAPEWLIDKTADSANNNVRKMSYERFLQLHETVKRYEKQGRVANTIRKGDEDIRRAEVKAELLATLDGMSQSTVQRLRGPNASESDLGRLRKIAYTAALTTAKIDALLLKVEFLLEALDGRILGPWQQTIYEPFNKAAQDKYLLQEEVSKVIAELVEALPKKVRRGFGKQVDVGRLGKPGMRFSRGSLIMMALNVGNESNLDKFIRGMGGDQESTIKVEGAGWNVNEQLIAAALDNLTKEEWNLVRGVWKHAEKLYPSVEAIYSREHGISPARVEPRTIKTKFGDIEGGYFPMMYDTSIAGVATDQRQKDALEIMQAETGRASVNSSMTKSRTGYAAPVNLDISRLASGLDNTIHFITHYEAVRNANKVLGDRDIKAALENKVGIPHTEELTNWVAALAANGNDREPIDIISKLIQQMYNNTTVAVLGFSYSTLAMQTLGLTNGQDRLLADSSYSPAALAVVQKDIAVGVQAAFSPAHVKSVMVLSGEMRGRRKSMDREVAQVLKNISMKTGAISGVQRFSMEAIAQVQFYTVDIPVWTAAYNRSLRGIVKGVGKGDTDAAVLYADRVVRQSQSAGGLKDLSAIQRQKGLYKGLTMFYSFFSALYAVLRSVGAEFGQNVRQTPIASTSRAATRMFVLLALSSIGSGLVRGDLPDWEDDEDEETKSLFTYIWQEAAGTAAGSIPVVRDIATSALTGYGYSGGAGSIAFESVSDSLTGLDKIVDEWGNAISGEETTFTDGEWEAQARKYSPYVLVLGVLTSLPAVQINRTLDGLGALYDDAPDWNWTDAFRGYKPERAAARAD